MSAIAVCTTVMLYWLYYPFNILNINDVSFRDGKSVYRQGESIDVIMSYDKFKSLTAQVNRSLIKQDEPFKNMAVIVIASSVPGMLPVGKDQKAQVNFIVPMTTPPGKYKLHVTGVYRVNPLRDIYEEWESPVFEVMAK